MDKENLQKKYIDLKTRLGKIPTLRDFRAQYKNCDIELYSAFGENGFNKLKEYCGDEPSRFGQDKSDLETILINWGELVRNKGSLPNQYDWKLKKLKPTISGIKASHNLNLSELPRVFLDKFKSSADWADVVALIPKFEDNEVDIQESECFVYLKKNQKGHYKIGISIDPINRERTLMAQDPQIKTIAKKKYINKKIAGAIEKAFHQLYSHKRVRGEWFLLDEEDLNELITTLND